MDLCRKAMSPANRVKLVSNEGSKTDYAWTRGGVYVENRQGGRKK